jgi:hypothetical protein
VLHLQISRRTQSSRQSRYLQKLEARDESQGPATARAPATPSAFEYHFTYSRGSGGFLSARGPGETDPSPPTRGRGACLSPLSQSLDSSLGSLQASCESGKGSNGRGAAADVQRTRRTDLAPLSSVRRVGRGQVRARTRARVHTHTHTTKDRLGGRPHALAHAFAFLRLAPAHQLSYCVSELESARPSTPTLLTLQPTAFSLHPAPYTSSPTPYIPNPKHETPSPRP